MAYNHSDRQRTTKTVNATDSEAGYTKSLHHTKGYRRTRIAPANNFKRPNLAQKLLHAFRNFGA